MNPSDSSSNLFCTGASFGTQSPPLDISVKIKEDGFGHALLSVEPPSHGPSPALDICIVIDTSGSMGEAANPKGTEEVKLFSKMDLAKRGAEVIIRALGPQDTVSIIGFDSSVKKWLPYTHQDVQGQALAFTALSQLEPAGCTALWDGLLAGLTELDTNMPMRLKGSEQGPRHPVLILLTDGQPQPSPPAGEVEELRKYVAAREAAAASTYQPHAACKLVTMGFGYEVNSKLLVDLANENGPGSDFVFIPDGTMLLTVFVNLMANLQSTCTCSAVLHISSGPAAALPASIFQTMDTAFMVGAAGPIAAAASEPAADVTSLIGVCGEAVWGPSQLPSLAGSGGGMAVYIGDILYGQPRTILLQELRNGSAPDWRSWNLVLRHRPVVLGFAANEVQGAAEPVMLDVPAVTQELHRAFAVSAILKAARVAPVDEAGALKLVKDCALATMALQGGPLLRGLEPHPVLEDLLGQVSEAVETKGAWRRWGAHYMRSLLGAHKAQACNNFKDPGALVYGGQQSRARRDELNAMCDGLPAPTPSIMPRGTAIGRPCRDSAMSSQAFTAAFNNRRGGCFGLGSRVRMAHSGGLKPIELMRKGDWVHVPGGVVPARVSCVVTYSGVATVRLPGSALCITPWHPVRIAGVWTFPALLVAEGLALTAAAGGSLALSDAAGGGGAASAVVYNLVLETGHVVVVDGVEAVTLGHGILGDPVVSHPYFGTSAVLDDLRAAPGYELGLVNLGVVTARIDSESGLVSGFTQQVISEGGISLCL